HRRWSAPELRLANWKHALWLAVLLVALGCNASWLIASADSIVARHTDRFVRATAEYIRRNANTTFLLSSRVRHDIGAVMPPLANTTLDPAVAAHLVFYAREGMRRWHEWPANRRGLTEACFGPREVNFNMYPNWWGDDRIVIISRRRAEQIDLHVAGISPDRPPPDTALPSTRAQRTIAGSPIVANSLTTSWALPAIDPRLLVPLAEAEAIIGQLDQGPLSGGWELDGTACTYLGSDGLVASIAVISTAAFDLQRHDPEALPFRTSA
ncbi:MAG: hypothetical protein ABJB97_13020, partial [Acidobacteriota bacterium]